MHLFIPVIMIQVYWFKIFEICCFPQKYLCAKGNGYCQQDLEDLIVQKGRRLCKLPQLQTTNQEVLTRDSYLLAASLQEIFVQTLEQFSFPPYLSLTLPVFDTLFRWFVHMSFSRRCLRRSKAIQIGTNSGSSKTENEFEN